MSQDLIVCSTCGSVNRIPETRSALDANCGKCGEQLFAAHPRDVDAAIFERQIARSSVPVLVDIWAPWCGPCKAMAPAYEAASRELEPHVRLIKVNSDVEQSIAARLGIRGIPTMILFKNGQEAGRISGALSAPQIVRWVSERVAIASA
ncbi:MAG: thioredoxin TrxC [Hyphomicrobiales bacterium]|nr:thioredoxin TrxC [Hyphomicrobiales bacterium]